MPAATTPQKKANSSDMQNIATTAILAVLSETAPEARGLELVRLMSLGHLR
jgi:hypothetical protein